MMRLQEKKAANHASEVFDTLNSQFPDIFANGFVDPFAIARIEFPMLKVIGDDFKNQFDGQLEYHSNQNTFLLFYNTKYDSKDSTESPHHPRTRFSVAHELGHYYLEKHRAFLMKTGKIHQSKSEFTSNIMVEREADAFAASLLMPQAIFASVVNKDELTISRIKELSDTFQTSRVSTAIRSVQLSDFPCAIIGIREGKIVWRFLSDVLIEGKCYPKPKGPVQSPSTKISLASQVSAMEEIPPKSENADQWFWIYGAAEKKNLKVTEHYLPVPIMNTFLVLLTISEEELFDLD
jgi:hypothetical protein